MLVVIVPEQIQASIPVLSLIDIWWLIKYSTFNWLYELYWIKFPMTFCNVKDAYPYTTVAWFTVNMSITPFTTFSRDSD